MKVFDLACDHGHRFEGWFASAEQYGAQRDARVVRCPLCDSADVHREPSAPRLNFGSDAPATPAGMTEDPGVAGSDGRAAAIAASLLNDLRRLVARTEDVGPRFAEEARRIHYDETPARPIRGTATDRERRDLADEGIETIDIPVPRALTETMQ